MSSSGSIPVICRVWKVFPFLQYSFLLRRGCHQIRQSTKKQHCLCLQESALDLGETEMFLGVNSKETKSKEAPLAIGKL